MSKSRKGESAGKRDLFYLPICFQVRGVYTSKLEHSNKLTIGEKLKVDEKKTN